MDPKFKPYKAGHIEVLEKYPCGKCGRGVGRNAVYYLCRCGHCGKEFIVSAHELAMRPYSCGCRKRPDSELPNEKHQGRMTKEMRELAKGQPKPAKNSKSRVTGVHFDKRMKKWRAEIYKDGKTIHLGSFEDKADAIRARVKGFKEYGCRSRGRSKK